MKASVRKVLARLGASVEDTQTARVRGLADEIAGSVGDGSRPGPVVLYGPSFSIHQPCYLHDAVFSLVLRARGAWVVPIFCDQIQSSACNVYGGDWGGDTFPQNCLTCDHRSRLLWSAAGVTPLPLSRWVRPHDRDEIARSTTGLGERWTDYEVDGLPLGPWAHAIVRNMALVGSLESAPQAEELGLIHVRNLALVGRTYERAIQEVEPDRIVTNDSYYGMWGLLEQLAARHGIPFYSTWQGPRPGTWVYAQGAPAMERELSAAWDTFSARPLSEESRRRVEGWLSRRPSGADLELNTATPLAPDGGTAAATPDQRPTALLAANVVWDLAALDRQLVFGDMVAWVAETIRWFAERPQYRLIVKAHPVEEHPDVPQTREQLLPALERLGVEIPENVTLVPPRSSQSVYELAPDIAVVLVHTSTVGVEMAATGTPVILTGDAPYRGFGLTFDPTTPDEYRSMLEQGMAGELIDETGRRRELAYHYIDLEYLHNAVETGFLARTDAGWEVSVDSMDQLEPGRQPALDHVVAAILNGEPIVGPDRWPPPPAA